MSQPFQRLFHRCRILSLAMLVALWPALAWAQTAAQQPDLKKAPPIWLGYLVMTLLLAVVLAISLMPSKRGHQD